SRIEPPARAAFPPAETPAGAALAPGGTIPPPGGRSRFPEERTVALMGEELARRGQRTLLVDADRQQGAGLLLGIDAPAGCVQRTTVPNLDYLGSARLTDLEIADCFAGV